MTDDNQPSRLAQGVYAALATPRRPNSMEANTAAMLDYLDAITAAGVNGLVLFGSTGEFVHFDTEERLHVTGLAIKRSRVPVLVNVSHSTLAGAIALAEGARTAGAAGLLLTPPYFYRYGDDQIFEFYAQFLRAAGRDTPVYIYNLPSLLNPVSAELAKRLLESGEFSGMKDSSGDWSFFESLQGQRPSQSTFRLLIGNESIYLRARSGGADGAVSGVAAAVPELIVALDHAITARNGALAEQLNRQLLEFLEQCGKFPASAGIRQAAVVRGWQLQHAAVPFDDDLAAEVIAFHAWFRGWLPSVLNECSQVRAVRT